MSYLSARFGGVTFNQVEGYRVSACLTPGTGFGGLFHVYVWDRMEAGTAFEERVDVGESGRSRRGTLELADGERSYKFENIDLRHAEVGVTRRERYRLLEFRFDKAIIDTQSSPVTLTNSSQAELKPSALDEDYTFSLGGGAQHLLGFRALVSAEHATCARFVSLRTRQNSFLQKVIEVNKEQHGGDRQMPRFTVTFSQGDLEVTKENLVRVYVDESYGELRRVPLPTLSDLVAQQMDPEVLRVRMNDFTGEELLDHDTSHQFVEAHLDPKTVETATFVFQTGFQRSIRIR